MARRNKETRVEQPPRRRALPKAFILALPTEILAPILMQLTTSSLEVRACDVITITSSFRPFKMLRQASTDIHRVWRGQYTIIKVCKRFYAITYEQWIRSLRFRIELFPPEGFCFPQSVGRFIETLHFSGDITDACDFKRTPDWAYLYWHTIHFFENIKTLIIDFRDDEKLAERKADYTFAFADAPYDASAVLEGLMPHKPVPKVLMYGECGSHKDPRSLLHIITQWNRHRPELAKNKFRWMSGIRRGGMPGEWRGDWHAEDLIEFND